MGIANTEIDHLVYINHCHNYENGDIIYGEGSYRLCLLPNPYYGLYIIKICLNKKKKNGDI